MSSAFNIPAGFALVPLEPTHDMLNAGAQTPAMLAIGNASAITQLRSGGQLDPAAFKDGPAMLQAYRAMLAAAPTPPVDAVPGEPVACCGWPGNGCACQVEYEAAPQEPVAYRTRYRSEPGMIGHYPWTYTDRLRGRLDFILEKYEIEPLYAASVASRAGSEPVAMKWYELNPPMLELGRTYLTRDGRSVKMVEIANAGKEYESMADEVGHHRYSRSHGRIIGRCTGSANDDPGNIVFEAPPAGLAAAAEPSELADMEARKDAAYLERNQVVAALAKCFPSGVARTAIEGWSEDWHGCVYIDLPTGQASWHFHDSQAYLFEGLPPYTGEWDGHDTPEKYRRLAALPDRERAASLVASEEKK